MLKDYFSRLETLDRLIRTKSTGNPRQLAGKLSISESRLYDYLAYMKEMGAPIVYCKHKRCYYYSEEGSFNFQFQHKTLNADL